MPKLTRTRAWDDAWNLTQPVHQLGFQIDRTPAQQEVCDEMEKLVHLPLPVDAIYHAAAAVRAAWQVGRESVSPEKAAPPQRPDNFEFAMDFLGDPEAATLRQYIEALERAAGVHNEPALAALNRLEEACDRRAGLTTPDAYCILEACPGMPEALQELDEARKQAQGVLAAAQGTGVQPAAPAEAVKGPVL